MSDEANFLKAIRAAPADDLPRLVFADWLDEHGEGERAEFIRADIHLHRWQREGTAEEGGPAGSCLAVVQSHFCRHGGTWFGQESCLYPPSMHESQASGRTSFIVRRGFVDEVRCTLAGWCGGGCMACGGYGHHHRNDSLRPDEVVSSLHCNVCRTTGQRAGIGPAVVAAHPVTAVVLTDRHPAHVRRADLMAGHPVLTAGHPVLKGMPNEGWMWLEGEFAQFSRGRLYAESARLPSALIDHTLMRMFPSRDEAADALSARAIRWAREQAYRQRVIDSSVRELRESWA